MWVCCVWSNHMCVEILNICYRNLYQYPWNAYLIKLIFTWKQKTNNTTKPFMKIKYVRTKQPLLKRKWYFNRSKFDISDSIPQKWYFILLRFINVTCSHFYTLIGHNFFTIHSEMFQHKIYINYYDLVQRKS